MSRTLLVRLSVTFIALGCAWVAYTQAPPQGKQDNKQQAKQANNKLNKITDDLYEIEGDGGNVAVYITNEGVIVVDDKFEYDFNDIMAKIKSVTSQPVKYVLNTHHHGDHTGSNAQFPAATEIISTANARKNMIEGKQPGAPRVVFTDETDVFLGGKQVQMRYFGRGHTNGDAMVYFPALRLIHTGDLVAGASPLIDYGGGGSLKEWAATLDAAMKLDFDTVIPGHGPVGKKADILTYRNNVEKLRLEVTDMLRQNKSRDEIAKVVTDKYGWAPTGLQFQRGFDGMLVELRR